MADVFFNELHYDNVGTDSGEGFEIAAAAGTNLSGWTVVLYNGSNSAPYGSTINLSGTVADQQNGYGTISVTLPRDGLQNGSPDALALIDPMGNVIQFLSYEGVITAVGGAADGLTSTDIGVAEGTATPVGYSLQLTGTGTTSDDFTWASERADTFGAVNTGQSFGGVATPQPGAFSIGDVSQAEGDGPGTTDMVFTVTRDGGSDGAVAADWALSFGDTDTGDFGSGQAFSGTVDFADGQTSATITIAIQGDGVIESDEAFNIDLSNATGGATIADGSAVGTIQDDDTPTGPVENVFINEIHYDNSGTDVGEGIELAGVAGTDLSGWTVVLYNGNGGASYKTVSLSGTIADQQNGFGTISVPIADIQNGSPDGIALVDDAGRVVQFLSYEGTMTASDGPAAGLTSIDIGVAEEPAPGAGFSVQLTGSGSAYEDFTWNAPSDDSFGAINDGQTFLSTTGTGHITVGDSAVVEGDDGISYLVFDVRRAGGTDLDASVDYTIALDGSADSDDLGAGAVLSGTLEFDPGVRVIQVSVPIQGDTVGEGNETLSINLSNPVGDIVVDDATAIGTIVNDDPVALAIYEIQGEAQQSAFIGQPVITTGIVTAVDSNGYYLQDAIGDGNNRTSDGIFVFTSTAPAVAVGDGVSVTGTVGEFFGDAVGLSVTQIADASFTVDSHDNALPDAILIGADGILPPSQVIDDDGLTSYDPATDGIDFWESLEGMRVTIDAPQVVSNTNGFGETDVVASGGVGATGVNARGGITISPNGDGTVDYNPEKIQIDNDAVFTGFNPDYSIGDRLSSVTGIVNYSFDNYEVLVTEAVTLTDDVTLTDETTNLVEDANHLSIATYNLENLDPGDMKYDVLAHDIVFNLQAPDIIAVQEIQDGDGAGNGADLSGYATAQGLIDAIVAQGGPEYVYVEVTPDAPNTTGGEPGGNIRNGYFYDPSRVNYIEGSAALISDASYNNSRSPLVAAFEFNGTVVNTINVHFTSRGGSDPLWGSTQPPTDAGDDRRTDQADAVKAYIDAHLADDPALSYAVLGDFNGFYFETAQQHLTDDGVLTNLNYLLSSEERYSYQFGGNSQQIDNILVTDDLLFNAQYDSVHLNSEFGGERPTDHDPQLTVLFIPAGTMQTGTQGDDTLIGTPDVDYIDGLGGNDTITGLASNDTLIGGSGDDIIEGGDGDDILDGGDGIDLADYLNANAAVFVDLAGGTATGGAGNDSLTGFENIRGSTLDDVLYGDALANAIQGSSGDDIIFGRGGADALRGGEGDDVIDGGAGDDSLFGGDGIDIVSYQAESSGVFAALNYAAARSVSSGNDVLDGFENIFGSAFDDRLIGDDGANILDGGEGNDRITGRKGDDMISGDGGNDVLEGNVGNDMLIGGAGDDRLVGGADNDLLLGGLGIDVVTGGRGGDVFQFASVGDVSIGDRITDFRHSQGDLIDLSAIDADANTGGDDAFLFIGSGDFSGQAGQLRYYLDGASHTIIEIDRDGDGIADSGFQIQLDTVVNLVANDFVL